MKDLIKKAQADMVATLAQLEFYLKEEGMTISQASIDRNHLNIFGQRQKEQLFEAEIHVAPRV